MTKYAWLQASIIRDICNGDPGSLFHPDVAALYDTVVPDEAMQGDTFENGVLTPKSVHVPVIPEPVPVKPPKVTVIEYKMLFTSAERIAAKASIDSVIVDLRELMDDPRTVNVDLSLQSISDALDYMTAIGLIAAGRKAQILLGVVT